MTVGKTIPFWKISPLLLFFVFMAIFLSCPSSAYPNGTETLITTDTVNSAQVSPAIYGDIIAWEDGQTMNPNIRMYNLATGEEYPPFPDENLMQTAPALSGHYLVWQQLDTISFVYSIIVYDINTRTFVPLPANSGPDPYSTIDDNVFPGVYGDLVVWQDYNGADWDIKLYNLTTPSLNPIITGPGDQRRPVIYNNYIAYENRTDFSHPEIWMYDIRNATTLGITAGTYAILPAISQDFVVWEDPQVSPPAWKIFRYNIITGITTQLTPAGLTSDQKTPSLHNNRVVLEDYRRSTYPDIYLYDITTGEELWISPQVWDANQKTPKIADNRIVWEDSRSGTSDIYMMTLGSFDACPTADFTPSVNAGSSPLTVTFTDHSTGSPILHRIWNYSDGTTSYPLDPASQTFFVPGIYPAQLTVSNLKCRNATPAIAQYDIYVDTPPVAEFTAIPREGFAPLAVQFTDTSGGGPATWSWDFGDGSISHIRNPIHSYLSAGQVHTVSLTVNNTYAGMAPDTKTKTDYIRTFLGATGSSTLPIEGIRVISRFGNPFLLYNATMLPDMTRPLPTVLTASHPDTAGWKNITFISLDSAGFADTFSNHTYMGNVSRIFFQTEDVTASGVSPGIGTGWGVSYALGRPDYPETALIATQIWESTTSTDRNYFQTLVTLSNFVLGSNGIAYTAHVTKTGIHADGAATLNMSVNRAWIGGAEAHTYIIGYGLNSQGDTVGRVMPARYLFNDGTLDYFEAEVSDDFTKFGIAPLSGSGNPLQLITLTVASHISQPSGSPGNDDIAPGAGAGAGKATAPAPVQNVNPPKAPAPPDPGKTEKIYTNANGVITQPTLLESTDHHARISLGLGVVAKDRTGAPLTSVTVTALPAESLPSAPSPASFTFAGMAYTFGPDGATFSPGVTLSFTYPGATWGEEYSVKEFDPQSGTWQDLPTTHDPNTGMITAEISHFCCIALFAKPLASANPASQVITPVKTQVPPVTPPPPPTTALNIFFGMIIWVTDLVIKNVYLLVIVVVLGIAYGIKKRKYPGSGL